MSYTKSHCGVTTVVTITSHDLSWFQWIVLDRFQCGESCALSTYTTDFFAEHIYTRVSCRSTWSTCYCQVVNWSTISICSFMNYNRVVVRCNLSQLTNTCRICWICTFTNVSNFLTTHIKVTTCYIDGVTTECHFRTTSSIRDGCNTC